MQDPNEDTEWNDVLRAKGIIPEKPKEKEVTEDDIVSMLEKTIKEKSGGNNPYEVPYLLLLIYSIQLLVSNNVLLSIIFLIIFMLQQKTWKT